MSEATNNPLQIAAFRGTLRGLTDKQVAVVKQALEGFVQTQEGSDEEVLEDWNIKTLEEVLDKAETDFRELEVQARDFVKQAHVNAKKARSK